MNVGCGPRESKDGGECIYNCTPHDKSFCRVEFVDPSRNGSLGNLRGLCFKNKACFGTPKACTDCNLKCQDYIGCSPIPTSAPAPATALAFVPTPAPVTCRTNDGKKCQSLFIFNGNTPETDSAPFLDKTPTKVLFPDRLPINDLSTGIPVDETHCVRRATNSIKSACLVSNIIENNQYISRYVPINNNN